MDDPALTFVFNVLFLLLVPLVIGLASSTLLRATLWSASAIYLLPAFRFSLEMIYRISSDAGPPEWPIIANWLRVMAGSAAIGACMGLAFYCLKRMLQWLWRAVRSSSRGNSGVSS
jgi:hypothetical protein